MKFGDEPVLRHSLKSLRCNSIRKIRFFLLKVWTVCRILGSVGEPINPEAWLWYYKIVGKSNCSIVDTFWQTETGGHVITPLPGATPMKPGSAVRPND